MFLNLPGVKARVGSAQVENATGLIVFRRQPEGKFTVLDQLLLDDIVENRHNSIGGNRLEGEAEESIKWLPIEVFANRGRLAKYLPFHLKAAECDDGFAVLASVLPRRVELRVSKAYMGPTPRNRAVLEAAIDRLTYK